MSVMGMSIKAIFIPIACCCCHIIFVVQYQHTYGKFESKRPKSILYPNTFFAKYDVNCCNYKEYIGYFSIGSIMIIEHGCEPR